MNLLFNPFRRLMIILIIGFVLMVLLVLLSVIWGTVQIPLKDVLAVFQLGSPESSANRFEVIRAIILELRIPRALLAIIVGAGLAMVGAMLQTVTRNDLADPFLFGLSAGAAMGAVFVIVCWGGVLGSWLLPLASFMGGIFAALTVSCLYQLQSHKGVDKLVICGLAISFLLGAITNYLIFLGDQNTANTVLFWSLGSLGRAEWGNIFIPFIGVLLLIGFWGFNHLSLDALLAGEETASSLGINVAKLRTLIFLMCALTTSTIVSLTGIIGFIGLMVPHLVRPLTGVRHLYFIPAVAMVGSLLMLLGDLICRLVLAPQELPLGIVTAAIGAIFVLCLVFRAH